MSAIRDKRDGRRWFSTAVFVLCIPLLGFLLGSLSSSVAATNGDSATLTITKTAVPGDDTDFSFTLVGLLRIWYGGDNGEDPFNHPAGVAVDGMGSVYVADTNNHRIQKTDSDGIVIWWGSYGSGDGQFYNPTDVAVDADGNVYVVDYYNHRIQKFDGNGTFIRQLGGCCHDEGRLWYPHGVAVDVWDNVYVTNTSGNRVDKFDKYGNFVTRWGSGGSGDGQFSRPTGVAVDTAGNVYVADSNNHRIQKFDGSGTYQSQLSGNFSYPEAVDVDGAGNLYVADTSHHRIRKFDNNGAYLTSWGSYGSEDGLFDRPTGVAVDTDGHVYVADNNNGRIQKFVDAATSLGHGASEIYTLEPGRYDIREALPDGWAVDSINCDGGDWPKGPNKVTVTLAANDIVQCTFTNLQVNQPPATGELTITKMAVPDVETSFPFTLVGLLHTWYGSDSGEDPFNHPAGVATDGTGNVYVADTSNHRVQKFDSSGTNLLAEWGGYGSAHGQFYNPTDVAVDADGNVYVVDYYNHRIQKFDGNGTFIRQLGGCCNDEGRLWYPHGVAVDVWDNVYVTNTSGNRVDKFDKYGNFVTRWGSGGSGDGQFSRPTGVAVDTAGNVYVADSNNHRIQKFDGSGTYQSQLSGNFSYPEAVDVDGAGNLYVADTSHHRIRKFDNNGAYLTSWGSYGSEDGLFDRPTGVAVDTDGHVYVADNNNGRIQKFVDAATSLGHGTSEIYTLEPGRYDIREALPDGWAVDSINCDGGDWPKGPNKVTVTLAANDIVQCTFTNLQVNQPPATGELTITKMAVPDVETSFPFTLVGLLHTWYGSDSGEDPFNHPAGVATDGTGNVYVADTSNHRVQKFDSSGTNLLAEWGGYGSAHGQFYNPTDVAVDADGNVYVVDYYNHRIQKFDGNGTFIRQLGGCCNDEGRLWYPHGVAVDVWDNVYVTNTSGNRVDKFDKYGNFVTRWGSGGSGDGQFSRPTGVAVDTAGNVYVADSNNHRIQKFDGSGTYQSQLSGNFSYPEAVDVDGAGNLYVADTSHHRIRKFDNNGAYLTSWGSYGSEDGLFDRPTGVAVDTDGHVYVADNNNGRIQKFVDAATSLGHGTSEIYTLEPGRYDIREALPDGWAVDSINCDGGDWPKGPNKVTVTLAANDIVQCTFTNLQVNQPPATGELTITKMAVPDVETSFPFTLVGLLHTWYGSDSGEDPFNHPSGVATDGTGNVYVADTSNHRIQKFDSSGTNLLAEWGGYGSAHGQFYNPTDVAVDSMGNVYVVDYYNHRLQMFDLNGTFIRQLGGCCHDEGRLWYPHGVAVDVWDNVYVTNTSGNRVDKFDKYGNFVTRWGSGGSGDGQFSRPTGVAVDTAGNVYVADSNNHRIQKFDGSGTYQSQLSGNFSYPEAVDVDGAGNLYVADTSHHRIRKFDNNGAYLTSWGSYGSEDGLFDRPTGVAVDTDGHVYVADNNNGRIQKFVNAATSLKHDASEIYTLEPGRYDIRETPPNPERWSVSATCLGGDDPPPGTNEITVNLAASDEVNCSFTNTLSNEYPIVASNNAGITVIEGEMADNTGTYSDPDGDMVTLSASVGVIVDVGNGNWDWSFAASDGPIESPTVTVTATDSYNYSSETTFDLVVNNVAPAFEVGDDETLSPPQAGAFSRMGITFSDPGADFWSGEVDWDEEGQPPKSLDIDQANKRFDLAHTYTVEGTYTVLVTVEDDDGGSHSDSFAVTVHLNTPPTAEAGGPYTVDEGGSVPLDGSGSADNEQDPATLTYEWDLDGDGEYDDAVGINPAFSAANLDGPDSVMVGLKVSDGYGESDTDTAIVTINNVAPTIHTLEVPWEEPVNIDEQEPFNINVTFSDPAGATDEAYSCAFDVDYDGEEFAGDVTVPASYGSCSTELDYGLPGVYTVSVTVTDTDGGSDSMTATEYIVIYDPEGGFVTGGGWIMSPLGACPRCPSSPEGKANFGFVSKYKKGASEPTGNTNFQFKSGDLHFKSSSYEWLVIAGANAKYKGEGTVNGEGAYKFMLTATDGDLLGGGHVDEFRIRIWDDNGLYYDNKGDLGDEEYGGTELGGGKIKIHKAK